MRIAVWYNLPSGGAKRALHDHVKSLASRGHELEFFTPSGMQADFMPLSAYGKEHLFPTVHAEAGVRFWRGVRGDPATRRKRLSAVGLHCRHAATAIDAGRFDVLFANTCWVTATPPIGRYCNTPSALYLQEPRRELYECDDDGMQLGAIVSPGRSRLAPWYIRHWVKDRLENPIRRQQVRDEFDSARAYRKVLVNSYFSRESVLRSYALDSEVCYLGIDPTAFSPPATPTRDYLIGLGSFSHNKNIPFALRAIAELPPPRPRLVWVGNSVSPAHYLTEVSALAAQLGVEFEARKLVPQAELTALLGNALAMLYSPRLEPFGYAPLEANACGTPVVAVAEGGVRETVRDGVNGLVVAAKPAAMAAAIRRLQADPELVARLGRSARALVESEWSLDAATDRLEAALTEVAAAGVRQ